MTRTRAVVSIIALAVVGALVASGVPAIGQTPKSGGVMNVTQREDLAQGFSIHETATISTVWPSMPCFNNLVLFDPAKPVESMDTVVPELAERWAWQDGNRSLVFTLRQGVKWHDGQPFTSKDVKYTFDVVREAPEATARIRINPRKDWYANVDSIEAPDPHTVVFKLKRPQPSLLMMLASAYSPVYPAHVPVAEFRSRCVGTGPFKLKEWKKGESIELTRNPEYWNKELPHVDQMNLPIVPEYATAMSQFRAGRIFTYDVRQEDLLPTKRDIAAISMYDAGVAPAGQRTIFGWKTRAFRDERVRQAMSMSWDRDLWIDVFYNADKYKAEGESIPLVNWREMFLIRAEVEGGQRAIDLVNEIRTADNLPRVTYITGATATSDQIRYLIIEERRRALYSEGRYFYTKLKNTDLLWFPRNIGAARIAGHNYFGGVRFLMPQNEFELNDNLKLADLKSRNNSKSVAMPRQIAMYLCKSLTHASLPEIGRSFGAKHHSTVIHSIRKVEDLRKKDGDFNSQMNTFIEGFK